MQYPTPPSAIYPAETIEAHRAFIARRLRPDPAQRGRLEEIRDNLIARIAEAEREGWLGEVEGLRVSLAGADEKLMQLDARLHRRSSEVFLGVPSIEQTGARDLDASRHVGSP
ncbi:hypothetical protein ACIRYZ_43680 [Kitasatospora sp. NPDC101155]|uniref:hypothetical protein n=1 Tax=Kitasatospora sp. NPDC101155 TaxID=3364097 RepID=UPI0038289BF8